MVSGYTWIARRQKAAWVAGPHTSVLVAGVCRGYVAYSEKRDLPRILPEKPTAEKAINIMFPWRRQKAERFEVAHL